MKLYLIADDVMLTDRWKNIFPLLNPTVLTRCPMEIESLCVIMISDTSLADMSDGLLKKLFDNRVMILSIDPNYNDAQKFLELGAMGYGNAMMHEAHLHSAYQALSEGQVWLHPDFISLMISKIRDKTASKKDSFEILNALSNREREVALMLGEGATHQNIADELDITVRTVKAHAGAIYEKLRVKDRLALSILLHS